MTTKDEALKRIADWNEHPVSLAVECGSNGVRDYYRQIAKDALTQPEQEPVAWGIVASNTGRICQVEFDRNEVSEHNQKYIVPLYTTPQPAPAVQEGWEELSAWWDSGDENFPNLKRIVANMLASQQPAPAVQPTYNDIQLAEQIMSDCGCSTNNQSLLERITQRLAAHGIGAPKEDV